MAISPLQLVINAVDNASPVLKRITGETENLFSTVTQLSFAYNNVQQAISSFAAAGQKAYQLLIGQNVELQQQLLATQASLAATNKVLVGGLQVADPGQAIRALTEPVNEAIAKLRKDSLELVGVTSKDLVPIFQLIAQNSAAIGANLGESSSLAIDFAAALGTLGIPLFQARQEINSILTAQITSDSQLAKSINLNNEQINAWKAQGVLVERLTEKLSAFRAGNQLAAKTIEGVSSNIQEIIDEVARTAGAPLLEPIVAQLTRVYNFLQQNQALIQQIAVDVVNFFLGVGEKLGEAVKALEPALKILAGAFFTQANTEASVFADIITILVDGFVALVKASAPFVEAIAKIVAAFTQIISTDIGKILLQSVIVFGALSKVVGTATVAMTAFQAIVIASGGGLAGFKAALVATFPVLGTFTAGVSAANLALAKFQVSMALSGGGIAGFAAAIKGVALPALAAFTAALAPIIALGGVVTLTLIYKKTEDLRVANEELEAFFQQNELLANQSLDLAQKLKILNEEERANGKLTEEQTKNRVALRKISTEQVEALKRQIAAIKEVQPANEAQLNTQKAQVAQLENQIRLLNRLSGGTELQSQDLQKLGNSYEQLAKKVKDAENQFATGGGGDAARFKQAADEIVKFTEQRIQLGQEADAQAAIARLEKIRDDNRVEFATQLAAQQAITKIRQQETEKRVKAAEIEQQMIEVKVAAGQLSQIEGDKQVTANKRQQLQLQLEATEAAIIAEESLRKKQVEGAIARLDEQLLEIEARRSDAEARGDRGGVRIANEEKERVQAEINAAQASLGVQSETLQQLKSQRQKFNLDIAKLDADERKKRNEEELKDFDEQQAILEGQFAQKLVSQAQFNRQSLKLTEERIQAEIRQLQEQRRNLSPEDNEGLEAIAAQEAKLQKQLADARKGFREKEQQARLQAFDAQKAEVEALYASLQISQQEFDRRSLELTQGRLQAQLEQVRRSRASLKVEDTERLNELLQEESQINKQLAELQEQFFAQQQQARLSAIASQRSIIESAFEQGQLTQQEFAQASLENTIEQLDAELAEVERQRSRINATDERKQQELAAKEAEINARRLQAQAKFYDEQLRLFEQAQQEALQQVELSQVQRETQLTELLRDRILTEEEVAQQQVDLTRERIAQELELEQEKTEALLKLPTPDNPELAEKREQQIRSSRIRTANLTKQLVDNEIQAQQALTRVVQSRIDEEILVAQNNATAQTQSLNAQLQINQALKQSSEILSQSLQQQSKLLETRKNLVSAESGLLSDQLNILKETSKSGREQRQIAETAAQVRLDTVRQQAEIEQQILELNLEQEAAALRQKQIAIDEEKIQLNISQIQARAATLRAQAQEQKTLADPTATAGQRRAAQLEVQAAFQSEAALSTRAQGITAREGLLASETASFAATAQARRRQAAISAQTQEDRARLELAQNRFDRRRGRREERRLRSDILDRLGANSISDLRRNTPQVVVPELNLPQFTPTPVQNALLDNLATLTNSIQQMPKMTGDVNINITNDFANKSEQSASTITQQIRKELFDLGTLLTS